MKNYTLGPLPWTEEMLKISYFRDFKAAERAIQEHPGFEILQDLTSLDLSLAIFKSCVSDLLNAVDGFHKQAEDPRFWTRPQRDRFEQSALAVTKAVFAAAASALALVDHSRAVRNRYSVPGYDEKRVATFDETEHEFIQGLRHYASHFRVIEADWQREYTPSGKQTKFLLRQSSLLRWKEWTKSALQFIHRHPKGVDIEPLFQTYARKVATFQQWFRDRIQDRCMEDLSGYLHYERTLRRFAASSSWRILLANLVEKSGDPFAHLDRYLTEAELAEVLALPPRSVQQVNKVIDILDEYGACDGELRDLVYLAFDVPSMDAQKG
jgi:hypothetical protein